LIRSLAVLEYLEEVHGAGFLPADAAGRARIRALAYAVALEIQPVCNLRVASHAVNQSAGAITREGWMARRSSAFPRSRHGSKRYMNSWRCIVTACKLKRDS
jgi:glutathione S-transferase